jgi:GNAT superfamily N-acetyltransferase
MVLIEAGCDGRPGLATLEPSDTEAVAGLFDRLSPESIYRRFFSPIARSEQFCASILWVDKREREAVAAVEGDELIGVAQYSRAPGALEADIAIVVADAWQRQGIGTRLVAALADRAATRGVKTFAVDIQGDNFGALRLFKRVAPGVRLTFSGGVGEGLVRLPGHENQ